MDGQNRLKSFLVAVPRVADDVSLRRACAVDLLAVIQVAGAASTTGSLALQKTPRAAAEAEKVGWSVGVPVQSDVVVREAYEK